MDRSWIEHMELLSEKWTHNKSLQKWLCLLSILLGMNWNTRFSLNLNLRQIESTRLAIENFVKETLLIAAAGYAKLISLYIIWYQSYKPNWRLPWTNAHIFLLTALNNTLKTLPILAKNWQTECRQSSNQTNGRFRLYQNTRILPCLSYFRLLAIETEFMRMWRCVQFTSL